MVAPASIQVKGAGRTFAGLVHKDARAIASARAGWKSNPAPRLSAKLDHTTQENSGMATTKKGKKSKK